MRKVRKGWWEHRPFLLRGGPRCSNHPLCGSGSRFTPGTQRRFSHESMRAVPRPPSRGLGLGVACVCRVVLDPGSSPGNGCAFCRAYKEPFPGLRAGVQGGLVWRLPCGAGSLIESGMTAVVAMTAEEPQSASFRRGGQKFYERCDEIDIVALNGVISLWKMRGGSFRLPWPASPNRHGVKRPCFGGASDPQPSNERRRLPFNGENHATRGGEYEAST